MIQLNEIIHNSTGFLNEHQSPRHQHIEVFQEVSLGRDDISD